MKSAALDTSVVMRLLTGMPRAQAEHALDELTTILTSGGAVFVSDLVISEVYFALQHHYQVPKEAALVLLAEFVTASGVTATGAAADVLRTPRLASAKPGFVDRLIHAEGIGVAEELLTFEAAGRKLKHTRVLNSRNRPTSS